MACHIFSPTPHTQALPSVVISFLSYSDFSPSRKIKFWFPVIWFEGEFAVEYLGCGWPMNGPLGVGNKGGSSVRGGGCCNEYWLWECI